MLERENCGWLKSLLCQILLESPFRMGNLFSRQEKPSKDEIQEIRNLRTNYIQQLQKFQTSTNADVQSKQISPDTASLVFAQIKKANTWLEKNPNATILEITANRDATTEEIQRVLKTDQWKRIIRNYYEVIPTYIGIFEKENKLTSEQGKELLKEKTRLESWYTKNQLTATPLDFEQQQLQLMTKLDEIITNQDVLRRFKDGLNWTTRMQTSQLLAEITEYNKKNQAAKDQQIDYEAAPEIIMGTATSVFFGFLLVVLCISAGSVAANMAIGRTPAMRLLYFIYGSIPIFAPFVLLYAIYIRIAKGPIGIYAVLPVSIEPATTRLAKLFWQMIYWVPDKDSVKAFKDYEASLQAVVSTATTAANATT
jgi:hypothetical protein